MTNTQTLLTQLIECGAPAELIAEIYAKLTRLETLEASQAKVAARMARWRENRSERRDRPVTLESVLERSVTAHARVCARAQEESSSLSFLKEERKKELNTMSGQRPDDLFPESKEEGLAVKEESKKASKNKRIEYTSAFEDFWLPYPRTAVMSKLAAWLVWQRLSPEDRKAATKAVESYQFWLRSKPDHPAVHACRFLSQRRFDGFSSAPAPIEERPDLDGYGRVITPEMRKRFEEERNRGLESSTQPDRAGNVTKLFLESPLVGDKNQEGAAVERVAGHSSRAEGVDRLGGLFPGNRPDPNSDAIVPRQIGIRH